uniref:Thymidylate synthase ThyX n=1 Tax=uncultured Armatimonadetes bacterium TaxID=157466 RepID=A0A6J4J2L2_9BACT|nr:Thymidylate synthase ThyX [uncultured Armatimonadetes bacterium]
MLSRNSSSSRALPIEKMILRVLDEPVIPVWWGRHQPGMQAEQEISARERDTAIRLWLDTRNVAAYNASRMASLKTHRRVVARLNKLGYACDVDPALAALGDDGENEEQVGLLLHKQVPNRMLEPWMWITVIVSATEWGNFFALRCHPDAQPEIQKIAYLMRDAYRESTPSAVADGDWHLPYLQEDEAGLDLETKKAVSVARCARVSYLTHAGVREIGKDLELFDRLRSGSGSGHWSPFEHVAQAASEPVRSGNFVGWLQYRKQFPAENQAP